MAASTPSRLEKLRAAFATSARVELALCHYADYDAAIAALVADVRRQRRRLTRELRAFVLTQPL